MLIRDNTTLQKYLPNIMATVQGETPLFDKLLPFLTTSESCLKQTFTSEELFSTVELVLEKPLQKMTAIDAFINAVPSVDLILTPNGFGVVQNQNIAPASKERVERLLDSLEAERDREIARLLFVLPGIEGWAETEQGKFFASTLFPNLSLCRRLNIHKHVWREYMAKHDRLIQIENVLAEKYFSQPQMKTFRKKVMFRSLTRHPLEDQVIQSLQSYETMVLSDMDVHPQSYFDLVNIIRENPLVFPEWHASPTAELYTPTVFKNKKTSSGYWF